MEKLLVFGGTFNPIHNGHLALYRHFAKKLGAHRVLLIPSHIPPHKRPTELASGKARMEMCRLATADDARVLVSDMELLRGGASYTSDTLRTLQRTYPHGELYLVVGSDMLFTLDTWHEAEAVMQMAVICALARHAGEYGALLQKTQELKERFGGRFLIDNAQVVDVSSTQVRQAVGLGANISALVPPPVEAYLRRNGIYSHADE